MENQDYSHLIGGEPHQSAPATPAVGSVDYWTKQSEPSNDGWNEEENTETQDIEICETVEPQEDSAISFAGNEPQAETVELVSEPEPEVVKVQPEAETYEPSQQINVETSSATEQPAVTAADIEGIYEAVNSVFEKVERFQDIIKIQNKTIDRFSKGIVLDSRKPLLMELCDLYETVMFGIQEDDKAVGERTAEERCRMLRAKLDELMEVIQCTLEDNQVEIKNHPVGTDHLEPYQTVTGRETTNDIYRFADFDSDTNAIYVTDRTGFVVKTTEVSNSGTSKIVEHILRPEEVTKVILNKD